MPDKRHVLLTEKQQKTTKYLPWFGSDWPAMLICGQPRNRKIAMPMMNGHIEMIMSFTAATGPSFSLDMMRPPTKPPAAPANADDSAVRSFNNNVSIGCNL